MNDSAPPLPSREQCLAGLGVFAAPLAAFLGFSIQLLLAKHLLPIYGGTPPVWLGSSLYFQITLVLGYAWAVWLLRKSPRFQAGATVGLALVAIIAFHLPANTTDSPTITLIVLRLALGSLPAMLLLFSASPLLHGWLQNPEGTPPYHLYALSNIGSLVGLLTYPFLVEPQLGLGFQTQVWRTLFALLAAALAVAAALIWRSPARNRPPVPLLRSLPWRSLPLWLTLSALGVIQLLGSTNQISGEIGSHPLAWVGPLGLYLLAFALAFSGRWLPWMTYAALTLLALATSGYMIAKGFGPSTIAGSRFAWLLALSAGGSFTVAALLHQRRPSHAPEWFYLATGVGGAIGGLVSAFVIPFVFSSPLEFVLASALILLVGVLWLCPVRGPGGVLTMAVVIFAPVIFLGAEQLHRRAPGVDRILHFRDSVGSVRLEIGAQSVVISSETTTHGSQLLSDADSRLRPTLYYTESGGAGRVFQRLQAQRPALRYGVIGLGAGTLAAYGRSTDTGDFWDIDAKSIRIARENFSYISSAQGKIDLILHDGRKALEASAQDYDLLILDAFNGDGVPAHLLTREALEIYFNRLKARNGLLVIHASSRFANLYPVLQTTARTLALASLKITTSIREAAETTDWDPSASEYIVVCPPSRLHEVTEWFPLEEDEGRVTRLVEFVSSLEIDRDLVWTDDRNAALDTISLGRFLLDQR